MNEKIRQLAEQSQLWDRLDPRSLGIPGGSTESRWGEELQEFAELIVRECSRVIVNGGYWSSGLIGPKRQYTPPEIAQMIKEHFGVEE